MPKARIPGLDAWRSWLTLAGLLVHADYLQESRPLFDAIGFVSAHFRMGVFMVISGLLAGIASANRPSGDWWRRRAPRIAIPLVTGLAVTGPVIALLGHAGGLNGQPAPSPVAFHHLWFLLALLIYLPLVPALDAAERRFAVIDRLERATTGAPMLQCLVLGVTAAASATLLAAATIASAHWGPMSSAASGLVNNVPIHGPMFLLGVLLGRAPGLRVALVSDVRMPIAVLGAVLLLELASSWTGLLSGSPAAAIAVLVIALSTSPVLVAVLVLRSANRVAFVGPIVSRLSDASMTIYIVHYPILAVINVALGQVAGDVYTEFVLAILVAGVASYGFHRLAVRRSDVQGMLFNGRFPPDRGGARTATVDLGPVFGMDAARR